MQKITDPILRQAAAQVDAKVPPNLREDYDSVIAAGMDLMFNESTNRYLQEALGDGANLEKTVPDLMAGGMMLLYNESKRTMSIDAAMLALVPLMCQVLEYAEQALDAEITPELVAKITLESYRAAARRFGLDKQGAPTGEPQAAPQAQPQAVGGLLGAQSQQVA
jgi:hypothetical protein